MDNASPQTRSDGPRALFRLLTRVRRAAGFACPLLGAGLTLTLAAGAAEPVDRIEFPAARLSRFAAGDGPGVPSLDLSTALRPEKTTTEIRLRRETEWSRQGFYHRHLVPRLQRQLRSVGPVAHWLPGGSGSDTRYYREEISPRIERTFESGARKAVKDYLLEVTRFGASIDRIRSRRGPANGASNRAGSRLSTRFGISHGLPRFELGLDAGGGSLSFEVGWSGNASLEYRPVRGRETRFSLGYDRRSGSLIAGGRIVF